MSTIEWLGSWFTAFVLTQVVEMGVYIFAPGPARPTRERVAIAFAASAITHPIVWFVITPFHLPLGELLGLHGQSAWWAIVAVAETFAFVVEAIWLMMFGYRPLVAFGTSLVANSLSFTIGLFCYEVLGW